MIIQTVSTCIATGATPDEAVAELRAALAAHLALLREYGHSVPQPSTLAATVEIDEEPAA